MATTFHPFPFLPWELRARIWELTVEPRTVDVHAKRYYLETKENIETAPSGQQAYARLVSTTPVPATLQTCRESRNLGLYQKGLSEVEVVPEGGERRYVWLNFDIDTIDYGRDDLYNYRWAAQPVKRLKYSSRKFHYCDVRSFNFFENLIEAHIDCFDEEGLGEWYHIFGPFVLTCDRRNIHLIQSENNRTTTAQELEEEIQRREEEDFAEFANLDPVPVSEMLAGLDVNSLMPTLLHVADIVRNMEGNN
ncbi:hypothetical protein NEUTE1DRAFT_109308 [Neurospora tetrasperma FGSC 2508]|uniref:2EXR domain-containing protein n=1 Tax=Neurospora tetrasperma (strain FGSC 2508 / ATCC MYA-4615 / P0657) TaxID=510951 RepID=F8MIU4_NEUT8|nr:uncharacterized protein NEUTE1DRAFT_109308 [Neurospora tetrasperma FGSC 2508]EGO59841.1 hypothetical protein NEUTE1DRAFT_109308 [Neurospora tetrasperma FGSC 2508]EGZ73990.1 hypothetical protein NEUTE2DRAFT_63400 [Neurospora tetrasperma FGSC 2509]